MILLVPTDDDARGIAVDEIEPAFEQSPALTGSDPLRAAIDGRNTLTVKSIIGGGSLKILAARSPRNLRRHDARKLFIDEEDAMEVTSEGDPVMLAEKRTLAHPDRKIVRGSTPTDELSSSINRAYQESDQRIFEVPCPHCGSFFEIMWEHIVWPADDPDKAACACPHCNELIEERFKTSMVRPAPNAAGAAAARCHRPCRVSAQHSDFAAGECALVETGRRISSRQALRPCRDAGVRQHHAWEGLEANDRRRRTGRVGGAGRGFRTEGWPLSPRRVRDHGRR